MTIPALRLENLPTQCQLVMPALLVALALASPLFAQAHDEEFVGPFASWLDVKRDYGAIGDGKTDDTAALQRALDDLRIHKRAVLYLPAGTYRLTQTLKSARKGQQDNMVSIIGDDPSKVILQWDGAEGETMFQWDGWYSRLSRLTFDGAGRARICVLYGPAFSTYNEISDIVCRDAKNGIVFGEPKTAGQAETEVLRCQFLRCGTGLQTVNWNSMDIWVWYCRFEDCERGIHNVMGNWHAWENLFLRSRISDVGIDQLMAFSVVNNTSIGSNRFLDFSPAGAHTWGSPTSITGNRILDPTGEWAIWLSNAGPYLVVDNVMRLGEKARGVRMTWGDQTLVGNTYSRDDAVEEKGRFRRIDEKIVDAKEISDALPTLPPTPPRRERTVFEIQANSSAAAIQQSIDRAAKLKGQRPVIHLPMGLYKLDRTLVIPSGCDVQLIGDGASEIATRLVWAGPDTGVMLKIEGPSQAVLRDMQLQGRAARALVIEAPEEVDGRIFADQLNANGPTDQKNGRTAALRVAGFAKTSIQFRALQGNGNGGGWIEVLGTGEASDDGLAVAVFTGAAGTADGQYDVKNGGRLVVRGVFHERSTAAHNGVHLADNGLLSIDATRFSYTTSEKTPLFSTDDFRGVFTLASCILLPVAAKETCRFELRGDASRTSGLVLNCQFWVRMPGTSAETIWLNKGQPAAHGGLIGSNMISDNKEILPKGFEFLDNFGDEGQVPDSKTGAGPSAAKSGVDDATILRHLSLLRSAHPVDASTPPAGQTDIRIHRVFAQGGRGAIVEIRTSR